MSNEGVTKIAEVMAIPNASDAPQVSRNVNHSAHSGGSNPPALPRITVTPNNTKYILHQIQEERIRQDNKWGLQTHTITEWITILGEEFGEACNEANESYFRDKPTINLQKELIHTAAVCVAICEGLFENRIRGIQ